MSRTGLEDAYIMRGSKKLRMGYTTVPCAAAAARGAAFMLLSGKEIQEVKIHTPKGIVLNLELLDIRRSAEKVSCAVRKDGGDDPDVTDKALIYAEVTFGTEEGIVIDGGFGVGRVTKPGLDQPVGNAAINHVPRQMIRENVEEIQKNSMISAHCRLSSPYRKGKNWQSIHSIRDLASPAAFQSLERAGL